MPALTRQCVKVLAAVLLLLSATFTCHATETLTVSVPELIAKNFPETTRQIKIALQNTGYAIEFVSLPAKRSLMMLSQGKIAIDILRNPDVVKGTRNISAIHPNVMSIRLKMVTSATTPEFCKKSQNEFRSMSMAGMLGIEILSQHYAPMFEKATTNLFNLSDVVEFVALQRANVTFLPDEVISKLPEQLSKQIMVCDEHQTAFQLATHISNDYLWAKAKIESAYMAQFGR